MRTYEYEVKAHVKGVGIGHRFTGTIDMSEHPGSRSVIGVALAAARARLAEDAGSTTVADVEREEQRETAYPRVAGRCPNCGRESLRLMADGHVTCSSLHCGAPTLADEILHDGVEAHAHELRKRAERAEARCLRVARAVDVRDQQSRLLVEALTKGGLGTPWWITATRALDSLDRLANSAQLEPDGETAEEAVARVGEQVRDTPLHSLR